MADVEIKVKQNGPLVVSGPITIVDIDRGDVTPGVCVKRVEETSRREGGCRTRDRGF